MNKYKYIIIGGGITGLITSIELSKYSPGEVLLIEKEEEVGGQLRTIEKNGFRYDIGSHIIHDGVDDKVLDYINEISGNLLIKNIRDGKLIFRNSFIDYPLKSIKFMAGLGFSESLRCIFSLLISRLLKIFNSFSINKDSNYEKDLKKNVGTRAYNIFYKPYALKVWNCDPKLISKTAIKRQMAMVGPISLLKELFEYRIKKQHDKYYYYLDGGIGKLPQGLEKLALKENVKILKNIQDFEIDSKILKVEINGNFESFEFEKLIPTISLSGIIKKLKFKPEERSLIEKVEYRGLKLIFLHVKENVLIEGESFYLPETKYKIGRVSIPNRFSDQMNPKNSDLTSIICEIPCSSNDNIWNMDTLEISKICFDNLKEAGLLKSEEYIPTNYDFHINIPDIYPMFYNNWKNNIKSILKIAGTKYPNIFISGKSGFFMQSNLDRSIEIGKSLPKGLQNGITTNEWYEEFDYYHNLLLRD